MMTMDAKYYHKEKMKREAVKHTLNALTYTVLSMFVLLATFQLFVMIMVSFMPDSQFTSGNTSLFPTVFSRPRFDIILSEKYMRYLGNTLVICLSNCLGVVITASFTAYGLAKVKMKGSKIIFGIIMATVLLPGTCTSIPLALIYMDISWIDTLLPLMLPIWFGGGAMNIFLVRQFIKGIPNPLIEAAKIDGASPFRIYWNIVLPLIKPILIYLAISTFLGSWNDFQGPLLYVSNNEKCWTLAFSLYKEFDNSGSIDPVYPNTQMFLGILMMIPGLVLYSKFQKEMTEGIAAIGVKG